MEINTIGNHVTGAIYYYIDTHLSLCYAFENEFLTIVDFIHKLQNQTYFILLELLLS